MSAPELRRLFNEAGIVAAVAAGTLAERIVSNRHPSAPKANVPYCTRSQLVQYVDRAGVEVATAHRYLRPDGTLGASGQPDPKRLVKDGTLYVVAWGITLGDRLADR